jgi:copper chaperone CopZ
VKKAKVDFGRASATVTYAEDKVRIETMVAALSRAGFSATVVSSRSRN